MAKLLRIKVKFEIELAIAICRFITDYLRSDIRGTYFFRNPNGGYWWRISRSVYFLVLICVDTCTLSVWVCQQNLFAPFRMCRTWFYQLSLLSHEINSHFYGMTCRVNFVEYFLLFWISPRYQALCLPQTFRTIFDGLFLSIADVDFYFNFRLICLSIFSVYFWNILGRLTWYK